MLSLEDDYRRLIRTEPVERARCTLTAVERVVWHGEAGRPSILSRELDEAQRAGEKIRHRDGQEPPALLVLPVGYSPEPLLLSVAHHAPQDVVLLEPEMDPEYRAQLREVWDGCRTALGTPAYADVTKPVRDSPEEVFRVVRSVVTGSGLPPERIVLDVTAGKKSMIAGAYLAAVHLGVKTSYVDFDQYDRVLRRPVAGTLRPGPLRDPSRLFGLELERRLTRAIDQRRYGEAGDMAEGLAEAAAGPEIRELLGPTDADARQARFRTLGEAARAYGLWSDGFYADALDAIAAPSWLPLPPTVEVLGSRWPHQADHQATIIEKLDERLIFEDPAVPLAYFVDVLAWWDETQVRKRPREGYVRLYGTVESAFSFLVHAYAGPEAEDVAIEVLDGEADPLSELERTAPETSTGEPIDWPREIRQAARAAAFRSSTVAAKLLGETRGVVPLERVIDIDRALPELPPGADRERIRAALRGLGVRLAEPAMSKRLADEYRRFDLLRHKAVHWLAPVPPRRAEALRELLCRILRETVPPAVARLTGDRPSSALSSWLDRLRAAASGTIPADCTPLLTRDLESRVHTPGGPTP